MHKKFWLYGGLALAGWWLWKNANKNTPVSTGFGLLPPKGSVPGTSNQTASGGIPVKYITPTAVPVFRSNAVVAGGTITRSGSGSTPSLESFEIL